MRAYTESIKSHKYLNELKTSTNQKKKKKKKKKKLFFLKLYNWGSQFSPPPHSSAWISTPDKQ